MLIYRKLIHVFRPLVDKIEILQKKILVLSLFFFLALFQQENNHFFWAHSLESIVLCKNNQLEQFALGPTIDKVQV